MTTSFDEDEMSAPEDNQRDDEPFDRDDAIIEDTVHCSFCGASWVLGSNGDGIILNLSSEHRDYGHAGPQLKLCMDCAAFVARTYQAKLESRDICEHGVLCGDWCESCNRAYKEAAEGMFNGG